MPGQMPGAAPRSVPDDGFPDDWHVPPSAEGDGFPDDWYVPASAMAPEAARPAPNPQPSVANLASFDRPAAGGPAMGLFGVSRYSLPFGGGPNPPGGPLIPGLFGTVMSRSALAAPAPESEDDDEEE